MTNYEVTVFTTTPKISYEEAGIIESSENFVEEVLRGSSSIKEAVEKSKTLICAQGGKALLL